MSDLLRRGSVDHRARRRPTRLIALLVTLLLGLGACGDGEQVPPGSEEGAPTIGWSLFQAAAHQRQLVGMQERGKPPWELQDPTVIAIRPGEEPPKRYQGVLPPNTLVRPTAPYTIFPLGRFGPRVGPDNQVAEVHTGTDLSAEQGLAVVAAKDGTVTDIFWDKWGGNRVEVQHIGGLKTTYNHLQYVQTEEGARLQANEQLGTVGQTGERVTGPHLHFETWVDGEVVDPESFAWIEGDRVIPARRGPDPDVPVEDRQPLPDAKRNSEAIAASWGQPVGTLQVATEEGGTDPKLGVDGATAERKKLEQELQLLRGRVQELEGELAELRRLLETRPTPPPGPDPLPTTPASPEPPRTLPPPSGTLEERVEDLEGQLRDVLAQLEDLESQFTTVVLPDLQKQLTDFRQQMAAVEGQVAVLEEQVTALLALQERVTSLEGTTAGLRDQVAVLERRVAELETRIPVGPASDVQAQIAALENSIQGLQGQIADLQRVQGLLCGRLELDCAPAPAERPSGNQIG